MDRVRPYLDEYLHARGKTGVDQQLDGTLPSRGELMRMCDGTVSQYDLSVAKRLRDQSKRTLEFLIRTHASTEDINAARAQYFAAERLYGKVKQDFESQSVFTRITERIKDSVATDD